MVVRDTAVTAQVDRILNSETFRNAEALRRLLRFLADKSLAGAADQLKEYSVGIEALGKPPSYDPRQDSVVRIQVGRLRQKLAEYYRTEGAADPVVLDLPKGRFRIEWESREAAPVEEVVEAPPPAPPGPPARSRKTWILAAALGVAILWAAVASIQLWRERKESAYFRSAWTPELRELWSPFLGSNKPLIVSTSAPLFVGFEGAGLYRDLSLNRWEDVEKSASVEATRKALKSPSIFPSYNFAGIRVVNSVFHLGKLLAVADVKVSLTSSTQLSWQQLADNNTVWLGSSRVFVDQLHGLPVELPFVFQDNGLRDLRAPQGTPAVLNDAFPHITEGSTRQPDSGEIYAVVTDAPGPLGSSHVRSFNSNHSPGTLGAVQAYTMPGWATTILSKLRKPSGQMPRYYQLVLKVKYKDMVPVEISYVRHYELELNRTPATSQQK